MLILLSHNQVSVPIYSIFLKNKGKKNKKSENHGTILVLIDLCMSIGRSKRPNLVYRSGRTERNSMDNIRCTEALDKFEKKIL